MMLSVRTLQPRGEDERTHLFYIDPRGGNPQGSGQCPTPLRFLHALRTGVDVGSTPGPSLIRVNRTSTGGGWVGHDANQGRFRFSGSTPDARADARSGRLPQETDPQVYPLPGADSATAAPPVNPLSGRMSMRQPVNRAARRAFCPSRPMANDSW